VNGERALFSIPAILVSEDRDMSKETPFSATFKLEKETKNTVRYAEEAEDRRPVIGTVYIDKYELPKPFPEKIRVTMSRQSGWTVNGGVKMRLGLLATRV
jgi:hypothetical protein